MKSLPKPVHPLGYTNMQILSILKALKISKDKFWEAFGTNTYAENEFGSPIYYTSDVENALYKLGCKIGKKHLWD